MSSVLGLGFYGGPPTNGGREELETPAHQIQFVQILSAMVGAGACAAVYGDVCHTSFIQDYNYQLRITVPEEI